MSFHLSFCFHGAGVYGELELGNHQVGKTAELKNVENMENVVDWNRLAIG